MTHTGISLCALLLGFISGCATPSPRLISLANSADALPQQFNADKHKTRVLALFSPT
jgi:hypothetical protein